MSHTLHRGQIVKPLPLGQIAQAPVIAKTLLVPGCMSAPHVKSTETSTTPLASAVAAPPAQSGASALSYGAVTATVVRGKTTQSGLLQMFGGPNISPTQLADFAAQLRA